MYVSIFIYIHTLYVHININIYIYIYMCTSRVYTVTHISICIYDVYVYINT